MESSGAGTREWEDEVFGSEAIEVAIGMALIFFLLATASSAVVEIIASVFSVRGRHLKMSLKRLIAGDSSVPRKDVDCGAREPGQSEADKAIRLVGELYRTSSVAPLVAASKNHPSYIPAKNFAEGILSIIRTDMDTKRGDVDSDAKRKVRIGENQTALEDSLTLLPKNLRDQVLEIAGSVGSDIVAIQAELENWFDNSMERASGVFKRWSRWWIIGIATVIVVLFNVDSPDIATALWQSDEARTAVFQDAEALVAGDPGQTGESYTYTSALDELGGLPIPFGWDQPFCHTRADDGTLTEKEDCNGWETFAGFVTVVRYNGSGHVLGWVLTILLVSLGAPFWYDAMGKLVSIRGSGGKPDKASGETASATSVFTADDTRTLGTKLSDPNASLAKALTP